MRVLALNVNSTAIWDLTHLCLQIIATQMYTLCTSYAAPTGGVHTATASASLTSCWLHSCLPWGEVPLCMLYAYKQLITNLQNLSFIISSINPQKQIHQEAARLAFIHNPVQILPLTVWFLQMSEGFNLLFHHFFICLKFTLAVCRKAVYKRRCFFPFHHLTLRLAFKWHELSGTTTFEVHFILSVFKDSRPKQHLEK